MISYVSGTVVRSETNAVVVNTAGIGYLINVAPDIALSAQVGNSLELHTELIVREDSQALYGFYSIQDLQLFQMLLKVSGVGPKSALAIIGSMGVDSVRRAVSFDDDEAFRRVPGIGPKTAKLICVQLSGKLESSAGDVNESELLDALTGLGYSAKIALEAIRSTNVANLSLSDGLRVVLAALSRKKLD